MPEAAGRLPAYPAYPAYPSYPRTRHTTRGRRGPAAAEDGEAEERSDPHAVRRLSLLEHVTRMALLEQLAHAPDKEAAARLFCQWQDQQEAAHGQAVADLWRTVGRFLVGLGTGADGGYGEATWRRLYLTEVAPWEDYAEGDEYRFLGLAGPLGRGAPPGPERPATGAAASRP